MNRAIPIGFLLAASAVAQTVPLRAERTSNTVLTIGGGCSADAPCNVRIGSVVHSFQETASVTLAGGTGTAFVYIAPNGQLTIGHNLQIQCGRCTAVGGMLDFPPDAMPLWKWTASAGKWDARGTDLRAVLATPAITASDGIVLARTAGETRIGLSPALMSRRSDVPRSASSECTEGDFAFDARYLYVCVAANQWRRAALEAW